MSDLRPAPTFLHRALQHLREALRFAPGGPAVALGVRASLTVLLPLAAAPALGAAAVWMSVGGFLVTLSDKGGPYRFRARNMLSLTLVGALSLAVAAPLGRSFTLAVPSVFLWASLGALARVAGPELGSVGASTAVLFVISLALPSADAGPAWDRSLGMLAGGSVAMALGLGLWPVRLYRPARRAVARSLAETALHATRMAAGLGAIGSEAWLDVHRHHSAVRQSLEEARATLAATRRGRRGESGRGGRLLTLLQQTDQMFVTLVALEDEAETAHASSADPELTRHLAAALEGVAATLEALGQDVLREAPLAAVSAPQFRAAALLDRVRELGPSLREASRVEWEHLARLLTRLRAICEAAAELLGTLHDERVPEGEAAVGAEDPTGSLLGAAPGVWETLRAHATWDSFELRHALRLGVTAAAAVATTHALHLVRGYWTTLTVIIVLQPHSPATLVKMLQRLGGTLVGVLVAVMVSTLVHDRMVLFAVVTVLAGLSAAVLQLNYALYSFLLTPTFVLLAELNAHQGNLAKLRLVNTLLGAVLALLGSGLLWPLPEKVGFGERLARPMGALRAYLDEVVLAVREGAPLPSPRVAAARREFGLAILNAEASFSRRLAESSLGPGEEEPLMTLLVYARRLVGAGVALALIRSRGLPASSESHLERFGRLVHESLEELERALSEERRPGALPDFTPDLEHEPDGLLRSRMERLALQLRVLRDAAERWDRARAAPPFAQADARATL